MTPTEMADWLDREAIRHERAKAMSGPYEASHPGDKDAARCRAIAGWIRARAAVGVQHANPRIVTDPQK
jgi:hypothetical protein